MQKTWQKSKYLEALAMPNSKGNQFFVEIHDFSVAHRVNIAFSFGDQHRRAFFVFPQWPP